MHPQSHTSPDMQLTLTSEPTRTINAEHPDGFDDWIIAIEPGGMHTHPDLLAPRDASEQAKANATQAFIDDIINDRTILIARKTDNGITDVSWLDPQHSTLESAVEEAQADPHRAPAQTIIFRLWSGKVLATVGSEQ